MPIEISPDEVEIHLLEGNGVRLAWRGWWIRHPALGTTMDLRDDRWPEEAEIYQAMLRQNGVTWLRAEIAGMSNHERLHFLAATRHITPPIP